MGMRMKLPQCDREQEVLDALRSGRWAGAWGEEIRQHVAECAVCAEVAEVARMFQQEAEAARTEREQAGLPSAGLVWWKAQRAARRAAEQRAAEPILLAARAAWALAALTLAGFGVWQWPRLAARLLGAESALAPPHSLTLFASLFRFDWLHRLAPAVPGQTPAFLLAAAAAAFVTFMAFAAYVVWRED